MTRREAKKWVRQHWATFMFHADTPPDAPDMVADVFCEESRKLAERLGLFHDFEPLPPSNPKG